MKYTTQLFFIFPPVSASTATGGTRTFYSEAFFVSRKEGEINMLLDHPHTGTNTLLFQHGLEVWSLHADLLRRPGDIPVIAVKGTE